MCCGDQCRGHNTSQLLSIYDSDEETGGMVAKFVNDTKRGWKISSEKDIRNLQRDLGKLREWEKIY